MRNYPSSPFEIVYYYTLKDLLSQVENREEPYPMLNDNDFNKFMSCFYLANTGSEDEPASESDYNFLASSNVKTLLRKYVLPKYFKLIIKASNDKINIVDTTTTSISNAFKSFFLSLGIVSGETYDYYSKILSLYEGMKDNLINKLEVINTIQRKDMDTPQFVAEQAIDDQYISQASKTESTTQSDADININQLNRVQSVLRNYYKEWADDFNKIFIYPEVL